MCTSQSCAAVCLACTSELLPQQEATASGELERARAAEAALAAARSDVEQLTAQLEDLRAQAVAKQARLPPQCMGC